MLLDDVDGEQPVFLSAQVIAPAMTEQGNGAFITITRYVCY